MDSNKEPDNSRHYCEDCKNFVRSCAKWSHTEEYRCWRSKKYCDVGQYILHPHRKELERCEELNKDGLCADFTPLEHPWAAEASK